MKRLWTILFAALALMAVVPFTAADDKKTRNPFGVADIDDEITDADREYFKKVELKGDDKDANAEQWVTDATEGKKGSLDGEWSSRWNTTSDATWIKGDDLATVKTVGDRVYILYKYGGATYLIDLKRDKNQIVGRYKNLGNGDDAGPCVLKIVGDERIDGDWNGQGRWDFRRKLK